MIVLSSKVGQGVRSLTHFIFCEKFRNEDFRNKGQGLRRRRVWHFCALVTKKVVTKFFVMVKSLISRSLKGLKSRGGGWFLGDRTEGADEFSREFGSLKAVKSEFKGT